VFEHNIFSVLLSELLIVNSGTQAVKDINS
jgi:hypothetical protein